MSKFGFESVNDEGKVINDGFIDALYFIDSFSATASGSKTYASDLASNYILKAQLIGQNCNTRVALWKNSVSVSGNTVSWVVDSRYKTTITILVTLNVQ